VVGVPEVVLIQEGDEGGRGARKSEAPAGTGAVSGRLGQRQHRNTGDLRSKGRAVVRGVVVNDNDLGGGMHLRPDGVEGVLNPGVAVMKRNDDGDGGESGRHRDEAGIWESGLPQCVHSLSQEAREGKGLGRRR
jgi:hypothetical protein